MRDMRRLFIVAGIINTRNCYAANVGSAFVADAGNVCNPPPPPDLPWPATKAADIPLIDMCRVGILSKRRHNNQHACCAASCGEFCEQAEGGECALIGGGGSGQCCIKDIIESGVKCETTDQTACIVDHATILKPQPNMLCAKGILSTDLSTCCDSSCGDCNVDPECPAYENDANNCCAAFIKDSGKKCLTKDDVACRVGRESTLPKFYSKSNLIRYHANGGEKPVIPLHLFQTDVKPRSTDEAARAWNDGMRYTFFNDCASYKYLMENWGARYANAFATLGPTAIRADFIRLTYVADKGGFYADSDQCAQKKGALEQLRNTGADLVLSISTPDMFLGGFIDVHNRYEYFPTIVEGIFYGSKPRHPALMKLAEEALSRVERRYGDDDHYTYRDKGIVRMGIAGPMLLTIGLRDMEPPVTYYRLEDTPDCKQFMFDPLTEGLKGNNSGFVTTHCASNAEGGGYWGSEETKIYKPMGQPESFEGCKVECPDWMRKGDYGCEAGPF